MVSVPRWAEARILLGGTLGIWCGDLLLVQSSYPAARHSSRIPAAFVPHSSRIIPSISSAFPGGYSCGGAELCRLP